LKDEPEQKPTSANVKVKEMKKAFKENMMLLAGKQLKFNKKSDA